MFNVYDLMIKYTKYTACNDQRIETLSDAGQERTKYNRWGLPTGITIFSYTALMT